MTDRSGAGGSAAAGQTLTAWLARNAAGDARGGGGALPVQDALLLFGAIRYSVKVIASRVATAGLRQLTGLADDAPGGGAPPGAGRDKQKKLDVVANEVLKEALAGTGCVATLLSEEEDEPTHVPTTNNGTSSGSAYLVAFDPLDGSSNIDASIPTGTIFGIYRQPGPGDAADVLRPGRELLAAGYALYSSATLLVLSLGAGTHGFTLDPALGEFVLSHPDMRIPARGQMYSLNDARFADWPAGLQRYIEAVRSGRGASGRKYAARYVCSLVADLHRTLLYGGWAGNPRGHLRLVYEAAPLAFVTEQAGGRATDGKQRILDIQPDKLHQRLPLFAGSPDDIAELHSYGDVQQLVNPGYEV